MCVFFISSINLDIDCLLTLIGSKTSPRDLHTSVLNRSQNSESIIRGVFDSIIDFESIYFESIYQMNITVITQQFYLEKYFMKLLVTHCSTLRVDFRKYFPVEFKWLHFPVAPVEPKIWLKSERIDSDKCKIDLKNRQ